MKRGGLKGGFSACTNFFFFAHCLCRIFFFRWTPLHEFLFQTKYCFFWTVKSWFIIYVFVLYKLFYTHNRSKDTGHFNVKSFRKCTHSERGWSHLEWTASLCIFFSPCPLEFLSHSPSKWCHTPFTNENHTLWFLIFVKSTGGSVAVYVVDS